MGQIARVFRNSGGGEVLLFVLSSAVPQIETVISSSRRWNKGRTQERGSTNPCHSLLRGHWRCVW